MFVSNWKTILRHAWSVRLLILAAVLSAVEVALPLIQPFVSIHPGIFAALSPLTCAGAFIARLVVQKTVSGDPK